MTVKFRAWDKKDKVMWSVASLRFYEDGIVFSVDYWGSQQLPKTLDAEDVVLMQATGVNDREGTEFYEGDIAFDDHQEAVGVVVFKEGAFMYQSENVSYYLSEVARDIHIVGNVYENPDLLEEEK